MAILVSRNVELRKKVEQIMTKIFVFVHGYGSAPEDFYKLPKKISDLGYHVEHFKLPGHENFSDEYLCPDIIRYEEMLLNYVLNLKQDGYDVYLVGFSLGATISIAIEKKASLKGLVVFGVFLGTSVYKSLAIKSISKVWPSLTLKRSLSVTKKEHAKKIVFANRFPIIGAARVIQYSEDIFRGSFAPRCKVLFIQSISDNVSLYSKACKLAARATGEVDFITIRDVKHYFIHDLETSAVAELILSYHDVTSANNSVDFSFLERVQDQVNEEHLFWANRVFQLVIAFFTVFGVFLNQTLPDVLDMNSRAPYFLLAYSSIILIYSLLASMYYFFMMRSQVYLVSYIEPIFSGLGFQKFKTSKTISGDASVSVSKNTSFVILIIPVCVAAFSFIQFFLIFKDRLSLKVENSLLIFWFTANVVLWILAVRSGRTLINYGKYELYLAPYPINRSINFSAALSNFYASLR